MADPAFSVLMSAYNASRTVESAIRSVLVQTWEDFELVVVDDGSTDDTAARVDELAAADPRVRLLRQENAGNAAARNTGLREARAPVVCLLDSDDLWLPRYLVAMGEALARRPDAAFAYTDAWVLDDETRRVRRETAMARQRPPVPPPQDPRRFLAELLERNFVYGSTAIRRAALDELGGFDASLRAGEDYLLWLRLLARGWAAVRAPGVLAVYRRTSASLSIQDVLMAESLAEVFGRFASDEGAPDDVRAAARARAARVEARLAVLRGERRLAQAAIHARRLLGRGKRTLLARRTWLEAPPPEVAAAFPDLTRV